MATNSKIQSLDIPNWGMTMETGVVGEWLIGIGDSFKQGDPLVTVESTKIANDLEAPFDGTLRRIVADVGQELPVGDIIGVSADPDVSEEDIDAFVAKRQAEDAAKSGGGQEPQPAAAAPAPAKKEAAPSPQPSQPAPVAAPGPVAAVATAASRSAKPQSYSIPAALSGSTPEDFEGATSHALRLALKENIDLSGIDGTGRLGRVTVEDIDSAVRAAGGTVPEPVTRRGEVHLKSTGDDSTVLATPVARRVAAELGVNLLDARPTGRHGRVTKEDVEDTARRFKLEAQAQALGTSVSALEEPEFESVPLSSVRKVIGQRLQASKLNSPHFRVTSEVNLDAVLEMRSSLNEKVPGVHLSINDMLIKAVSAALIEVPGVNVQFDEANQTILEFSHADISVAVDSPAGLITPIVRGADKKSLREISAEVKELATKAKANTLVPDEFQGGTFTISNLGMFGVSSFDAIINPPQAAILAVGAAQKRLGLGAGGEIVENSILALTLSSDHRVVDGALAARFMAALKRFLESPELLLV